MTLLKYKKTGVQKFLENLRYKLSYCEEMQKADYTIEFFVDGIEKGEKVISKSEDIVSACMNACEAVVEELMIKYGIDYENNINDSEDITVSLSPSGVLSIKFNFNTIEQVLYIELYIYDKKRRECEVLEYVLNKGLNEEQKEHILSIFKEKDVYSKDLEGVLEELKEEVINSISECDLKDLIKSTCYTIGDLVHTDLSNDILDLIDKGSVIYKLYRNVVSVSRVEDGYLIAFCGDVVHKINYNIELIL